MGREIIPLNQIARRIRQVRGEKVLLDYDLAALYAVETRALKQAVRRNLNRFPPDFMFELSEEEIENVVSQFVIPNRRKFGGAKPMAFTEQGVAMLSTVLNSERAIEVNITIMRAFLKLRQMLESNEDLNRKFAAVIRKLSTHDKYFKVVFDELKRITEQPTPSRKQIGFKANKKS